MKNMPGILYIIAATLFIQAQDKAPDLKLQKLDNTTAALSDYKGKTVVIDFWATWCAACKEAFPELNKISADYADKNLVTIGINIEKIKPEKIAAFVKKASIKYTVLLDPSGESAKKFGVKGVPTLAVIKSDGTIARMFRGMNKKTEKDIRLLLDSLTAVTPK